MATPLQPATPAGSPPPRDTDRFDNRLRFEWADPEQRVLLYSWAFAIAIAIVWLIIVGLHKMLPPTVNDEGVVITLAPPQTLTTPPAPPPVVPTKGTAATTPAPGETKAPPGRRGPERGSPKPGRPGSRTEQKTDARRSMLAVPRRSLGIARLPLYVSRTRCRARRSRRPRCRRPADLQHEQRAALLRRRWRRRRRCAARRHTARRASRSGRRYLGDLVDP